MLIELQIIQFDQGNRDGLIREESLKMEWNREQIFHFHHFNMYNRLDIFVMVVIIELAIQHVIHIDIHHIKHIYD